MKNQKGITLIVLLLVIIIVLLCIILFSNKNNTENTNNISNTSTNIKSAKTKDSKIIGSWKKDVFIYTFNADGTANLSGTGLNTQNYTYKIKGSNISLTNIETNSSIELEYSIKGDELYIGSIIYTKIK